MKERKQAVLRKIRIIRMIGKGNTAKKASDKKRIEMMLDELAEVENIVLNNLT